MLSVSMFVKRRTILLKSRFKVKVLTVLKIVQKISFFKKNANEYTNGGFRIVKTG